MPVRFYMDVHIPAAVAKQLRARDVDVLTANEEKTNEISDVDLLMIATADNRIVVTFDIGFRVMAESWQRIGKEFAGLGFARESGISIGQMVNDLEIMAKASEPEEWRNTVFWLPLS